MHKFVFVALLALAGCGSSAFLVEDDDANAGAGDAGAADTQFQFANGNTLPPGTAEPTADTGITRTEPEGAAVGSGFATDFTYDAANDSFVVDNLAFDGANGYTRDAVVGTIGGAAVYRADAVFIDTFPDPDAPINQFDHRILFVNAPDGTSRVAIVRTGAYIPYGFGGFIYERDGSVTLPTSGQARYLGDYAGIRDFDGRGGLELVRGDILMQIDFNDFNDGAGITGVVSNRQIFDLAGNDITQTVLDALTQRAGSPVNQMPTINWVVGPGVLDSNGEMLGNVFVNINDGGAAATIQEGNYYGLLSGDNVETLTGVIVIDGEDVRDPNITVRETAGYVLTRQ